ncbi:MAG: hypothetical protein GPJ21_22365 [Microcystis aeruginosa W13-11]|nr:hypothetical protein [Microcystis aeruginosa W13-11]
MDYHYLESEFDRIYELPLRQRPLDVSQLGKRPYPDIRKAFDLFSSQKFREKRQK